MENGNGSVEAILSDFISGVVQEISCFAPNGVRVKVQRDAGGRARLVVEITEDTTVDDVRDAWYAILELRESLTAWQGRTGFRERLLADLLHDFSYGHSYRSIADNLNRNIAYALETGGDADVLYATNILTALGMDEGEAEEWINAGRQRLTAGLAPYETDGGPVDAARVRESLRYWQKQHPFVCPHGLHAKGRRCERLRICLRQERVGQIG